MAQPSVPNPNASSRAAGSFVDQVKARIALLAFFVGSMWAVFLLSVSMPFLHLDRHGVVPRTLGGLQGILFAPWLHAGLWHITANTGGLLLLGWLAMWPRIANFWQATAGAVLGAGLCAWLLGAPYSVHIGASGVVFGYAGYLVARGFYTRGILSILIALFVVSSYGLSMLLGALPIYPGVSWQSHLGGAMGGIIAATLVATNATPSGLTFSHLRSIYRSGKAASGVARWLFSFAARRVANSVTPTPMATSPSGSLASATVRFVGN